MAPPQKILALHGVAQSGRVFERRMATIVETLSPLRYEFVFLTAPCDISGTAYIQARQADWQEGDEERSWWETDDDAKEHSGIDQAMELWGATLREKGPFVGVVGFSQGGCAAASLAAMLEPSRRDHPLVRKYLPVDHPPLDFLIMFSGNPYRYPSPEIFWLFYPEAGEENKVITPTLALYGKKEWEAQEFFRERQEFLMSRCSNVEIVGHPWQHTVPRTQEYADIVKRFVTSFDNRATGMTIDSRL
ncbi:hypothetical protein P152DRAFT_454892 [Eremomyces bilateralis CBS 781.70]|uniref:Serine hydrolase domain-containing protein n=1 Tax=Eremomyces bilateralis CBS 781.70 TaxID=1392243 RepID=A0A6G1GFG9_9PEZI|nr:uncharacterized protein P152DRAFT_454892 [Eremomyces bilateralis CBS 781.70]KAF1816661.1 hypothetical protein P152DRAFT_454892 [Eremomyces bilateralis CBS 781.70]